MDISMLAVILFAFFGGWLSRMAGGAPPKLPWGLDQWLYAIPYAFHAPVTSWWAILGYAGAFLGKRTGHGVFMDLGTWEKPTDDERLEFIIKPLKGKLHPYWYDFLGLALTGISVSLLAGVVLSASGHILPGIILALSGLTKAPAYAIGWLIYPNNKGKGIKYLNEATAIGEFLTGFFAYGILGFIARGIL